MKNKISILVYFFITSLVMLSCSKDPLDKAPLDSYTDVTVWNDLNLATAYVNNLYNILPSRILNWDGHKNRSWALAGACDDAYDRFNDFNVFNINTGIITPDNAGPFDAWADNYSLIQNCNIALSNIDNVPGDTSARNVLKGEATFLRAYAYFALISDYGGVPLITTPFGLNSDFTVARSSYDTCVDFISSELDKAAALLPLTQTDFGRATSAAALAIKSRVLLYDASPQWNPSNDVTKWQKASDAAKAVLDLNAFQLYTGNYEDILTTNNSEIILSRLSSTTPGWNAFNSAETFLSPSGFHGWSSWVPTQTLVDAFGTADGKDITDPTSGYDPQNPYVNRDPRFNADILYDGRPFGQPAFCQDRYLDGHSNVVEYFEGGLDSPEGWSVGSNSLTRYSFRKYQDTTYDHNNSIDANQVWVISRLAEIYLNYAEAQFYLGNNGTAIQYLNLIRQRAGITTPLSGLTGTALENKIRNERQVELCLEGHRYYDVRRWQIAEVTENKPVMGVIITQNSNGTKTYDYTNLVQTRVFLPQMYLLPIPRVEINQAPSLVQNPGYN
jgi:hypothetical protein